MKCRGFRKNIDPYLNDLLALPRREEFEAHYFECDRCFNALRAQQMLRTRNFLINAKNTRKAKRVFPALVSAASVLLMVGLGVTLIRINHRNYIQKISSFSPPGFMISETRGAQSMQAYSAAIQSYSQADFSTSLTLAETIPESSRTPKIRFLIGITRLITGDREGAINAFQKIIDQMDPSYYDEAMFYKGIALLRLGRIEEAKTIFKGISEMFSPMKDQAASRLLQISRAR